MVKFIDKPFIPGADGTKLYTSKCFPKYLYYLVLYASKMIDDKGYARHNALLKEFKVPFYPDTNTQIIIALTLDDIFQIIETIELNRFDINELVSLSKQKILDDIFGENSSYKSYYEKDYSLDEVLPYEQPGPYIVKSTKYNDVFSTPVLTPGKSFILGYTDEEDGIYDVGSSKVIIFDDFTTASRLIDFNFKVKSSAMKILKSSDETRFNIDYLFYLLQTIYVYNDTHKRYWISEYAPKRIKIHTYEEQIKIVNDIKEAYRILESINAI